MIRSGASPLGCSQPSAKCGAGGRSESLPFGALALTQAISLSISRCVSCGSFRNFALRLESAGHGGISCCETLSLIASAQRAASAYVIREDVPAICPDRWQFTQCLYRIGATSLQNVTGGSFVAKALLRRREMLTTMRRANKKKAFTLNVNCTGGRICMVWNAIFIFPRPHFDVNLAEMIPAAFERGTFCHDPSD